MSTPPAPATGPVCPVCGIPAVVNWTRRLTDDEMTALLAREQQMRDQILVAAPPDQPPNFGPLPTQADSTQIVFACAEHAIAMDRAALVHQNTCTAPNPANLPTCDCTPEPPPPPSDTPQVVKMGLPDHWAPTPT
jgi:hypothetical protein